MGEKHIQFCKREAEIAYDVLRVDAEPKRGGTQRTLEVQDNILLVTLTAAEARHLRVSVNSFLEHLMLLTETISKFGPPVSTSYEYQ